MCYSNVILIFMHFALLNKFAILSFVVGKIFILLKLFFKKNKYYLWQFNTVAVINYNILFILNEILVYV